MSEPAAEPVTGPGPGGPGLVRAARGMAIATLVSRVTGFARVAALTAVLGLEGLRQAFELANALPNALYELLLGGILASTLVPLLVEARAEGEAKAVVLLQRILTVVLLFAATVSVLAVLAAPVLVRAYNRSSDPAEIALSVQWARFFVPQILFYAVTATIGSALNTHGRFGPAVWAPVLNNLVVIGTLGVFVLLPGPASTSVATLTEAQLLTLGIGTTLGVVVMTVALLPALRATGFRWRLRLDLRGMGLRRMVRLASWVLVYVASSQLAFWVLTRLSTEVGEQPVYLTAFTVWQLPHALIAVSVITALLPRMSAHAVAGRFPQLRADLQRGLRLSAIVLLPAAVGFVVLGRDVTTVLFNHGATDLAEAQRVGWVLAVLAVGLLPFSIYQVQSRAFYAMRDTRTPALIQCAVSAVMIGVNLLLAALLPDDLRVFGLAAGSGVASLAGFLISAIALRRRFGPLPSSSPESSSSPQRSPESSSSPQRSPEPSPARMWPLLARITPSAVLAGAAAAGLAAVLQPHLSPGPTGSAVVLLPAGLLGAAVYLAALLVLRVPEAWAGVRSLRGPRLS